MVLLEETTYKELQEKTRQLEDENIQLKAELVWLKEQIGLAHKRLYAPKSEKTDTGQEAMLFNEAEATQNKEAPEPATETITYTRRKKAKGQRELALSGLPIEEIRYDLPEDEQFCPQCQGALHQMGEEVRQEVKIVPASIRLVRHIRPKYACRHCQQEEIHTPILTAAMPTPAFPNSLASPSAVAYIMSQKFVDALPLYRQEQAFARLGFTLSRQTMANWMIAGACWLAHIYQRMKAHLLTQDILHADETVVQVLKEAGRSATTDSRMWLYRTGRDGPPIILYEYQQTRDGQHARTFLSGFSGFLHVDGYQGYEGMEGVTLSGCFAHVRRGFHEALSLLPEPARKRGLTSAHVGLSFCNRLFAIERELADCTPEERLAARISKSQPVLEQMRLWLSDQAGKVLPKTKLGQAIGYTRNQWEKLIVFMSDGRLEIDNNRSERSIKPFVIGRKNWLFANTPKGATSSAVIYSIVETAKENGIHPFAYLSYLFEQLPNIDIKDNQALDALLPWSEPIQATLRTPTKPTS